MDARGIHHLARQTTLWLGAFAVIFGYFLLRYVVLKLPAQPVATVGPLQVSTFGPLVAMGILFGRHLIATWCPYFGLEWSTLREGLVWLLLGGFGLAHLMAIGEESLAHLLTPAKLFALRADFSSFGGFLGGTIAALVFLVDVAGGLPPRLVLLWTQDHDTRVLVTHRFQDAPCQVPRPGYAQRFGVPHPYLPQLSRRFLAQYAYPCDDQRPKVVALAGLVGAHPRRRVRLD